MMDFIYFRDKFLSSCLVLFTGAIVLILCKPCRLVHEEDLASLND
jgi:hypothetical protein